MPVIQAQNLTEVITRILAAAGAKSDYADIVARASGGRQFGRARLPRRDPHTLLCALDRKRRAQGRRRAGDRRRDGLDGADLRTIGPLAR